MTSFFEGQLPQNEAISNQNKGQFGFYVYIISTYHFHAFGDASFDFYINLESDNDTVDLKKSLHHIEPWQALG